MNTKTFLSIFLFSLFLSLIIITSCNQSSEEPAASEPTQEELVERGKYLVKAGGCDDCHSPKTMLETGPAPDTTRLLSGHPSDQPIPEFDKKLVKDWALFTHSSTAAVGPWGVSFAANITSDPTGIGTWNYEQFETAMRHGKYKGLDGSRPLMPPMPWQAFSNFTDQDLKAMFAYLKTTKPVKNVPPEYIPFDQIK